MAYNKLICVNVDANTGQTECSEDLGYVKRINVSNALFEFDTQSDAETYTNWISAITGATSPKVYPFPLAINSEDESGDPVIEEVSRDETNFIENGEIGLMLRLNSDVALGLHQELNKFNGKKPYITLATDGGYVRGTSGDGTKFQSIKTTGFYVERKEAGLENVEHTLLRIKFKADDWSAKGVWIKPTDLSASDWDPVDDLDGVKEVDLAATVASTASIVYSVTGTYDSEPIVGDPADAAANGQLEQTDFTFSTTLDGEIASFTNNLDGTYTLTPTTTFTVTGDTIDLNAPSVTGQRFIQSAQLTLALIP